jgi:hypothetical protein
MIIEVGKTYLNQAGSVCRVASRTDPPSLAGLGTFYSYFPLEDGKENREKSFNVDKYGSYLGELYGHDLVVEYKFPDLKWVWGPPDKPGIWAYGGTVIEKVGKILSVDLIESLKSCSLIHCWRCYLGPVPEIAQPKKPVKQTLWMVKCFNRLLWEELWLPDEETPKLWCLHDIAHKTCTTRTV